MPKVKKTAPIESESESDYSYKEYVNIVEAPVAKKIDKCQRACAGKIRAQMERSISPKGLFMSDCRTKAIAADTSSYCKRDSLTKKCLKDDSGAEIIDPLGKSRAASSKCQKQWYAERISDLEKNKRINSLKSQLALLGVNL